MDTQTHITPSQPEHLDIDGKANAKPIDAISKNAVITHVADGTLSEENESNEHQARDI